MTIDNKEPFTVQVGKRYVRRDGGITQPMPPKLGRYWQDLETSRTYTNDGRWLGPTVDSPEDLISEYKEPTTQDEWGEWLGWNGGECPVDDGVKFELVLETGLEEDTTTKGWDWDADGNPIIAYRVKQKPPAFTDSVWIDGTGNTWLSKTSDRARQAIITTQGDNISIAYAVDAKD